MVKFLGKGAFGNIMLVRRMSASCSGSKQDLFAMKAVPKDVSKYIEKEVFLHAVGHPFLVQLHSYFQTEVLHSL
jgi:hypothetical protein